ncbi:unnamed protein product, partial [Adineta steineri]
PPPAPALMNNAGAARPSTGGADRNGLLGEIGTFKKGGLKKAVTNDRSAPIVGNSSNNNRAAASSPTRDAASNRSNTSDRPSTAPTTGLFNITADQLSIRNLKPTGANSGSTVRAPKTEKGSIPEIPFGTPHVVSPLPKQQPTVKPIPPIPFATPPVLSPLPGQQPTIKSNQSSTPPPHQQ